METRLEENKRSRQETTRNKLQKVKEKFLIWRNHQKADAVYENLFTPVQ